MIEAYHGSSQKILKFCIDYVGSGHDQEGPGIYFTSNMEDAAGYGRYVHHVYLDIKKLPSLTRKAKRQEILWLLQQCDDLDDKLMDWNEDRSTALRIALNSMMSQDNEHQSFLSVWYDFYRYRPTEYVENMISLGYDAVVVPRNTHTSVTHYIVLNPKCIRIIDTL